MITSSVQRGTREYDAQFHWVLEVRGISECAQIRWEQFVSGGVRIHFSDGTSKFYSMVTAMQGINARARQFGPWTDDILPDMTPGPRPLGAYRWATCRAGVRPVANARATMRGPSADPRGGTYRFEDSPGFLKNFGDLIEAKTFVGITWDFRFEHKLWLQGGMQPLHRRIISLSGRFDRSGLDTRRLL